MCDMPEPCKFLSLDSCQKRFLWTQERVGLALHSHWSCAESSRCGEVSSSTWFQRPGSFLSETASRVCVSQPDKRMEVTRDLQSLNLLVKVMTLHCQILFSLTTAAIAEAILMRTSAEQLPFLHRVAPRYLKLVTSSNYWLSDYCNNLKNFFKSNIK